MTTDFQREFVAMVKRVQGALRPLGSPREVLPATFYVFAANAKMGGTTSESFVAAILPILLMVWNQDLDPQKVGLAVSVAPRCACPQWPPSPARAQEGAPSTARPLPASRSPCPFAARAAWAAKSSLRCPAPAVSRLPSCPTAPAKQPARTSRMRLDSIGPLPPSSAPHGWRRASSVPLRRPRTRGYRRRVARTPRRRSRRGLRLAARHRRNCICTSGRTRGPRAGCNLLPGTGSRAQLTPSSGRRSPTRSILSTRRTSFPQDPLKRMPHSA